MKTILFVSYYFPPSANSGSHRVLKLANELRKYNWRSIVITARNAYWGRNPRIDPKLEQSFRGDIHRSRLLYPCKGSGNSLLARLVRRIWSEITFPDDKVTWALTASFTAFNLVREGKIDCVFVTGPPYSSFLVGYCLKKLFGLPVCVDYRDPWTGSRYYIKRQWKHFLSTVLERHILSKVDKVYTVTPRMTDFISGKVLRQEVGTSKFDTLTYSFSRQQYLADDNVLLPADKFILNFAGSSFGVADPGPLLKAILGLKAYRKDVYHHLLLVIIGNLVENWETWISKHNLGEKLQIFDYMVYGKALSFMQASHLLLLPYKLHQHMELCLPVKVYDYLTLQKPILLYGPRGQLWKTIDETKTGYCRLPQDTEGIMKDICSVYDRYYIRNEIFAPDFDAIKSYRTEVVVKKLVSDIESLALN